MSLESRTLISLVLLSRVNSWKDVVAFSRENGYVEVEYYNPSNDRIYRCWVPEYNAQISYH